VLRDATEIILNRKGVLHCDPFVGFDGATFTNPNNTGVIFIVLKPFEERIKEDLTAAKILADIRDQLSVLTDSFVVLLGPPSVPGIGTGGGLKGYIQDRAGRGLPALENATSGVVGATQGNPGFAQAFTLFNTRTPQIFADIDRTKAELLGVPISRVFEALSVYMGSAYINDFNLLGRTYQVTAQADDAYRVTTRDVANLKTRNVSGDMVMKAVGINTAQSTSAIASKALPTSSIVLWAASCGLMPCAR
jgi:multidrug efflux pump subunit AcrB